MIIKTGNPDLYTVLKKRRSSVQACLEKHDVRTKKELNDFLRSLEKEYSFSNRFHEEANEFLNSILDLEKLDQTNETNDATDIENTVNIEVDSKLEKKIKKKTKLQDSKSRNSDSDKSKQPR